ncbi:MAG: FAD-dependent oxidoreductase [Deltaproteobacteria bacterium RBG_16_47_11]|nr:MAG: FAD-dependent oxidoreductase [Deltaproteobacteria bacterium RBG_16_47_11]
MKKRYQVVIVGAGPSAIFAAFTLSKVGIGDIAIFERGKDIHERKRGRGMELLCGWGGAGAFSDGKLTLSPKVGGFLSDFVPQVDLINLLKKADEIYRSFGAPKEVFGRASDETEALYQEAKLAGLEFIPMEIRHLGTENCVPLLKKIRSALENKVDIFFNTPVREILVEDERAIGVMLENGNQVNADFVISGPGRVGAEWIKNEVQRLGIPSVPSPVDIGVRVEAPASILQKLTAVAYEAKLIYYSKTFDDKVRTFCMNPFGEVVTETINEIVTVNGHSYAKKKTENTNFAILVSNTFTDPFKDPIGYGKYIARLANLLGNGVIVQRLGDLLNGRRSTPERINRCITQPTLISATPGDLSFVLPYRHLKSIIEMLEALDRITPGIFSRHTLLYGVEVKFYTNRVKISPTLETDVQNLFLIGDGAGITRGLMQASISGILAANEILKRLGKEQAL